MVALELDSSDMGHLLTESCAFGDMLINCNGQVMNLVLLRFEVLLQMRKHLLQFLDLGKEFLNVLLQLSDFKVPLDYLIL